MLTMRCARCSLCCRPPNRTRISARRFDGSAPKPGLRRDRVDAATSPLVGRGWQGGYAMTNPRGGPLKPSTQASTGAAHTWGPYWDILFPPQLVTGWINWKRMSTGVNVARRLWDQREYLRRTYESVHGDDPAAWPSQHPGVVLDAVLWMAHPACLRCHWFDGPGFYTRRDGALLRALDIAHRHEVSDGASSSRAIRRSDT